MYIHGVLYILDKVCGLVSDIILCVSWTQVCITDRPRYICYSCISNDTETKNCHEYYECVEVENSFGFIYFFLF